MSARAAGLVLLSVLGACGGRSGAAPPAADRPAPGAAAVGDAAVTVSAGHYAVVGQVGITSAAGSIDGFRDVVAAIARDPAVIAARPLVLVPVRLGLGGRTVDADLVGGAAAGPGFAAYLTPATAAAALVGPTAGPIVDPAPGDFAGAGPHAPLDVTAQPAPAVDVDVALGVGLAARLGAQVGAVLDAEVVLDPALAQWADRPPWRGHARVVALVATGGDHDQTIAVTSLAAALAVADLGDVVTMIAVHLARPADASAVAARLTALLGDRFKVVDLCALNGAVAPC